MAIIIGIIILSLIYSVIFFILIKKFNIIKIKYIITLFFVGGLLYILLQRIYFSFGATIDVNLLFFKGSIKINDFFSEVMNYFGSKSEGETFGLKLQLGTIAGLFLAAFLEEVGKFYILRKINSKVNFIKNISTAIIGITYVALGFSFFETCGYIIIRNYDILKTINLIGYRGVISTISHVFFSSIIAFNYGKVLFMNYYLIDNLQIGKTIKKIKFIKKIFPFSNTTISKYYYIKHLTIGLFLSIILHTFYNTFIEINKEYLSIIMVLIGIGITFYLTKLKKHNNSYKEINEKIKNLKEIKLLKNKIRSISNNERKNLIDELMLTK